MNWSTDLSVTNSFFTITRFSHPENLLLCQTSIGNGTSESFFRTTGDSAQSYATSCFVEKCIA